MSFNACPFVFNTLNLVSEGLQFCCAESRQKVPFLPVKNLTDAGRFAEFKQNKIDRMKAGVLEECEGCEHLRNRAWEENARIRDVRFNHFTKCNLRCYYCSVHNTGESDYNALEVVRKFEADGLIENVNIVSWGGGKYRC